MSGVTAHARRAGQLRRKIAELPDQARYARCVLEVRLRFPDSRYFNIDNIRGEERHLQRSQVGAFLAGGGAAGWVLDIYERALAIYHEQEAAFENTGVHPVDDEPTTRELVETTLALVEQIHERVIRLEAMWR